jgi:hypothetical protein
VKYGAANTVALHPVTGLTTGWYSKAVQGIPLVAGNPYADDYRRTTVSDAEGRFEFNDLPAGDYYLLGCLKPDECLQLSPVGSG